MTKLKLVRSITVAVVVAGLLIAIFTHHPAAPPSADRTAKIPAPVAQSSPVRIATSQVEAPKMPPAVPHDADPTAPTPVSPATETPDDTGASVNDFVPGSFDLPFPVAGSSDVHVISGVVFGPGGATLPQAISVDANGDANLIMSLPDGITQAVPMLFWVPPQILDITDIVNNGDGTSTVTHSNGSTEIVNTSGNDSTTMTLPDATEGNSAPRSVGAAFPLGNDGDVPLVIPTSPDDVPPSKDNGGGTSTPSSP
jgi:hypothetical protein